MFIYPDANQTYKTSYLHLPDLTRLMNTQDQIWELVYTPLFILGMVDFS
jgi:hypothetical protein